MRTNFSRFTFVGLAAAALAVAAGCGGQTRGTSDAEQNRAASPAENGNVSTEGAAGRPENFGDTGAKKAVDEKSPSGRSMTGGASTGGDYSLDRGETPSGLPTQSQAKPNESHNQVGDKAAGDR